MSLILLMDGPVGPLLLPPALVSVTILADGVTMESEFDQPLTAGSATLGFTRSLSIITSGIVSGNKVIHTIPKVFRYADAGTLSYSILTGTLAGDGGFVESFGPVAIANNSTQQPWTPQSEFSTSDVGNFWKIGTSDIFQLTNRTSPATSAGDPVGLVDKLRDPTGAAAGKVGRALARSDTGSKFTLANDGTFGLVPSAETAFKYCKSDEDPQGSDFDTMDWAASAWTIAACVYSRIHFGADDGPFIGFYLDSTSLQVGVGSAERTYTVTAGWRKVVVTKAAGVGGLVSTHVDGVLAGSYNCGDASRNNNRVGFFSNNGGGNRWRAAFYINKVVSDVAELTTWLGD